MGLNHPITRTTNVCRERSGANVGGMFRFGTIIEKQDGGFLACPMGIVECETPGGTMEEAVANMRESVARFLAGTPGYPDRIRPSDITADVLEVVEYTDEGLPPLVPGRKPPLHFGIIVFDGPKNCNAYAPAVRGCVTVGDTVEETAENMREALAGHLEGQTGYPATIHPQEITVTIREVVRYDENYLVIAERTPALAV